MDNPYQAPESELQPLSPEVGEAELLDYIPATTGVRWGAYMLDSLIVVPFSVLLVVVAFMVLGEEVADAIPSQAYGLVTMLPTALVFGLLEGSGWQGSPGKKLLGLRVVTLTGEDLDTSTAIKRNLAKYVGLGFCGLLSFTVLGGEGKSLWDNMAGTRVVRCNPYAG
jgi:uncharacterized RDD family membrane protein YckC